MLRQWLLQTWFFWSPENLARNPGTRHKKQIGRFLKYIFSTLNNPAVHHGWEIEIVLENKREGVLFSNSFLIIPPFKFQRKTSFYPEFAFHINPAIHNRHKLFDNGQPNANTIYTLFDMVLKPTERIEYFLIFIFRYPVSCISNCNANFFLLTPDFESSTIPSPDFQLARSHQASFFL